MTAPTPPSDEPLTERRALQAAALVMLAGVAAALHVGKLSPAIPALQQALGLTLVQAGFLLSMVQVAGMSTGIVFGGVADSLGLKRSMVLGLLVLAAASALGGVATSVTSLMVLRAIEGFGFLLVALPAPGLVRRLVPPQHVSRMLGTWGAYMPLASALALLLGPWCIGTFGWQPWWWGMAAVSFGMAVWVGRSVPDVGASAPAAAAAAISPNGSAIAAPALSWLARLRLTVTSRGPWLVALCFAMYSSQWLAVIGFLPTIYTQAGVSGGQTAVLSALAAAVNMIGNLASGRWLHRGTSPTRLLAIGYMTMALAATAAFAGGADTGLPAWARFIAVLLFSGVGGLIPGTLFSLAVRVAPSEQTLSTTVGWMQQWSSLGQFAGPPLVAWVASQMGGWAWTWVATGTAAVLGAILSRQFLPARAQAAP